MDQKRLVASRQPIKELNSKIMAIKSAQHLTITTNPGKSPHSIKNNISQTLYHPYPAGFKFVFINRSYNYTGRGG